jgi:hypothetical protein
MAVVVVVVVGGGGGGHLTCPLSLQQFVVPLMSSCGYKHALCMKDGEKATSHRKGLLTKLQSQRPCRYTATMRGSCVGGCGGAS